MKYSRLMRRIGKLLDKIPYLALVIMTFIGAVVPFKEPHLAEKTRMLINGELSRPIDAIDLFIHSLPLILIAAKAVRDLIQSKAKG